MESSSQINVTANPTEIVQQDPSRTSLKLRVVGGGNPIFLGRSNGVTVNNGYPLTLDTPFELKIEEGDRPDQAVYGIITAGTRTVYIWEDKPDA